MLTVPGADVGWLRRLAARFARLWRPRWRVLARVAAADEVPSHIPRCRAVVVGEPGREKWIAFECPCGRGHRILLNLDGARLPAWVLVAENPLSVHPSVDAAENSVRCHFVLRGGRVNWIPESLGRP